MGWFDSFFHPEKAYEKAEKAANAGYGEAQGKLQPWINQGQEQYGKLMGAENELLNPEALLNKWSSGYETSPYAKHELDLNREQGLEAASSMGLMGSSGALSNIQQGAGNVVSKDREQFLNRLMQQYLAGIGIGQNIYGTGANVAGAGAEMAFGHGNDVAGLEYGRQAAPGKLFGQVAGTALNAFKPGLGNAFTGQPSSDTDNKDDMSWDDIKGAFNKYNPWGGS